MDPQGWLNSRLSATTEKSSSLKIPSNSNRRSLLIAALLGGISGVYLHPQMNLGISDRVFELTSSEQIPEIGRKYPNIYRFVNGAVTPDITSKEIIETIEVNMYDALNLLERCAKIVAAEEEFRRLRKLPEDNEVFKKYKKRLLVEFDILKELNDNLVRIFTVKPETTPINTVLQTIDQVVARYLSKTWTDEEREIMADEQNVQRTKDGYSFQDVLDFEKQKESWSPFLEFDDITPTPKRSHSIQA